MPGADRGRPADPRGAAERRAGTPPPERAPSDRGGAAAPRRLPAQSRPTRHPGANYGPLKGPVRATRAGSAVRQRPPAVGPHPGRDPRGASRTPPLSGPAAYRHTTRETAHAAGCAAALSSADPLPPPVPTRASHPGATPPTRTTPANRLVPRRAHAAPVVATRPARATPGGHTRPRPRPFPAVIGAAGEHTPPGLSDAPLARRTPQLSGPAARRHPPRNRPVRPGPLQRFTCYLTRVVEATPGGRINRMQRVSP